MNHLGDITQIRGDAIPPVDVIIGGSPCQDLSVAGKRAGLAGERSGLYMEQIRIIKEMRSNVRADGHLRGKSPRYMVWENVPGAFSSNGGEDFRAVLEEAAHIVEPECVIPRPENGKWTNAGCIMGNGWSIAWRVHDAQFWGVPQRRRRIALVADFGGGSAPEILFEREGVRGDPAKSGAARQENAAGAKGCAGAAICIQGNVVDRDANCNGRGWRDDDVSFTLNTIDRHTVYAIDQQGGKGGANYAENVCPSILSDSHGTPHAVYDARGNGDGETCPTITGDHENRITDYTAVCMTQQAIGEYKRCDVASSCKQRDYKDATDLICAVDCRSGTENSDVNGTLQAKANGGMSLNLNNVVRTNRIVRRLTPLECERLQGYPDGWTDIGEWVDSKGKRHQTADSARYKALGNSIALPYWRYLLKRISAQFEYTPTMASLFDGIGGFPYLWEGINGKGSCLWASEIEEFPMAVTKLRIGE